MPASPGGSLALYRGVCIDNSDPLSQGRIRVKVPQIFGDSVSGWAFPAWPVGDLSIWPEDRMPATGQGVWIMFESWDHLAWIAIFGPVVPTVPDSDADYATALDWTLPVIPEAVAVTIPGSLGSARAGTPNPDPEVLIERGTSESGPWTEIGRAIPDLRTGEWSLDHIRDVPDIPGGFWYRATYEGTAPFAPASIAPEQPPVPTLESAIAMVVPDPVWGSPVQVAGTLRDKDTTAAIPDAVVQLYERHGIGSPWLRAAQGETLADGTWAIPFTRSDQYAFDLKAVFPGSATHIYAEAVASYPVMSIPTATTLSLVLTGITAPVTASGRASSAYGVPRPNPTVQLEVRYPATTGAWVATGAPVVPSADTGDWSRSYTPQYGSADYRAVSAAVDVFQSSASAVLARSVVRAATVSAPTFTAMLTGAPATATGVVREAASPATSVVHGTVELHGRRKGDVPWIKYGGPVAITATGTYSITSSPISLVGESEWEVRYLGDGNFYTPATSPVATASISAGTITGLTGGAISHTGGTFSWSATPGATHYELQYNVNGGAWSAWTTYAAPTTTATHGPGWGSDTAIGSRVRALVGAAAGPWSGTITINTGHPAVQKAGSFVYEARPTATKTYRPSDGWTYPENGDDVLQGYYQYSNNIAYGVMTYDGAAFRTWVTTKHGADVLANLAWNKTEVAMYRIAGSGSGSAVSIWWYVSPSSAGSGGKPALAGGQAAGSLVGGQSSFVDLASPWWGRHVLMNETTSAGANTRSFVIYRNNSTEYARFGGRADYSNACNIRVSCSWNFTAVALASPYWS